MATFTPIPRNRGSMCGVILILLGGWAGLAPFVGPYLHFGFTPDVAWKLTDSRLYLSALPGGVALFAGLLIAATRSRGFGGLCAFIAALAGGWLVFGGSIALMLGLSLSPGTSLRGSVRMVELTQLAFFGVGALIVFFAAIALGRFSLVAYKDVLRYGTDLTAASGAVGGGALAFDPFASSTVSSTPFTQPQAQYYPAEQQYPSQYPPDLPASSPTVTAPHPGDEEPTS